MPFRIICILLFVASFLSCKKDTKPVETTPTGSVALFFENKVDTTDLVLTTKNYVNQNGDTFKITRYKYYISNIILSSASGKKYYEPESYHLIDQAVTNSTVFVMHGVPVADYNSISFVIGVDSLRNCSGAQTGALDPVNGMFWDWTSGYIHAWLEGTSPKSTATGKSIIYQTVGFYGPNNVVKKISPSFGSLMANVNTERIPEIHISCNAAEWFKSPTIVNFGTLPLVANPGPDCKMIADNYADMFKIVSIVN